MKREGKRRKGRGEQCGSVCECSSHCCWSNMAGDGGQQVDEAVALKTFCKKRIQHAREQKALSKEKHQKRKCTPINALEPISAQSVPLQFLCTLRLKTLREEMKKGAEQDFHEPSHCRTCMTHQADFAMKFFIRTKTNQLQAQLLEKRIQLRLYRDTVSLLGYLLKDMPKPSDDPCEIWERVLNTDRQTLRASK